MVRRQVHVGLCNMPLLYRQKKLSLMIELGRLLSAISAAYPLHRTKALSNSCDLSATLNEYPPNHRMPIRHTG